MMKYYDYLLKSPLLLAIVALIIWCFIGIDLYRQIPIFCIIGLFFTFKNKEIMTQRFKLEFALYFAGLFALRNLIVLFWGMHDPWGAVSIITSLPFIIIAIPVQVLIALIGAYLSLLISNRVSLLLVKISELKNPAKYLTKPFVFLVEQPKYLIALLLLIGSLQFTYASIFYEKGKFVSMGIDKNSPMIYSNKSLMKNGNYFILDNKLNYPRTNFYIYNPKLKTILYKGEFKTFFKDPQYIELNDGKILIIGDDSKKYKNLRKPKIEKDVLLQEYGEIYDPKNNTITLTQKNLFPNFVFAMTLLSDGKVLIAGGAGNSKKAEIYDPKTNKFYETGELNNGRFGHSLVLLKNDKVLVIGGMARYAEIYDPKKQKFEILTEFRTNSWGQPAKTILLNDGRVFIVYKGPQTNTEFGNIPISYVAIYDPTTNIIQKLDLKYNNQNIDDFDATLLKNGKVLITGGKIPRGKRLGYLVLDTAKIFNPETNKFIPVMSKMKVPRYSHRTIALPNGDILIIGGVNNKQFGIKEDELFIPSK